MAMQLAIVLNVIDSVFGNFVLLTVWVISLVSNVSKLAWQTQ